MNYRKPAFWMIIVLVTALISIGIYLLANQQKLHVPIQEAEVQRAFIHNTIKDQSSVREFIGSDLADLVKWFKSASDIRPNPTFKGSVTIVGIIILLKDNREIGLLEAANGFEVQVSYPNGKKPISYWAKQPDIEMLLNTIDNIQ